MIIEEDAPDFQEHQDQKDSPDEPIISQLSNEALMKKYHGLCNSILE